MAELEDAGLAEGPVIYDVKVRLLLRAAHCSYIAGKYYGVLAVDKSE